MQTRPLGRTGIQVSTFTLGTMMFGPYGNPDPDACVRIVHRALDHGITTIDTADVYGGDGESERIVGKALRGRRDDVVLATKGNGPMGAGPNERGNSRRWIISAVEGSLRRLGVDHLDLYQLHHSEPGTDIEEPLSALTDLLRAGKVRAIGHSNLPASDIIEAQWVAQRRGLARFRTEQLHYSLLDRGVEREILPVCRRHGLGVLVWSPLSMGLLTGRHRKNGGEPASAGRLHWVPRHLTDERKLDAVEALLPLAGQAGIPLRHLALAFVTAHPAVASAIIGPRTEEQLADLLAGADTALGDDLLDRIDTIVPPGTGLGPIDVAYEPPHLAQPHLRRRRGPTAAGTSSGTRSG
ncbi:aldo/keto reductase [Amycolatopsis mediterranei S699]|uniref:Aldo/keto reductase n=2 Tax=Amycolatopsis mediterranei TaxID=33910 RepID=A0A0H3D2J6_AMYMU|nr:aldo/keto reductase [Amycolatopsis mediterranei]ADJ44870.1 aldo/keto reductase [Amycolatopsis mediterranei U32]AEK41620.1 aldo/keto reductase [Amycolatopsis mediterranei S699]AFO76580.1 aldo/keto reductase [Amycolatopsis mediterranei S699]AGT83709.1 aldo/keto reductase [Amycolatopsis mediterranei RB]KDO07304.1 aldo/keto reductase [Amycolatopsis mediterranei]